MHLLTFFAPVAALHCIGSFFILMSLINWVLGPLFWYNAIGLPYFMVQTERKGKGYVLDPWAPHMLGRPCSFLVNEKVSRKTILLFFSPTLIRLNFYSDGWFVAFIFSFLWLQIWFPISNQPGGSASDCTIRSWFHPFPSSTRRKVGWEMVYGFLCQASSHQEAASIISKHGSIHKYLRNLVLASFGPSPPKISCGYS